jgi:periplasmic protein CpxP/Spy
MSTQHLSIAFGFILSAGLVMAQAPSQSQADPASQQGAQSSPLTTESAPATTQGRQHAPNPDRAAHRLGKQLGLTQDQVAQIAPIIADREQQVAGVRTDASLTPRDRRAKLHGIQQDSKNKIEALLTDSQKQQYEQMLQQRRAQHQQQQPPQAQ